MERFTLRQEPGQSREMPPVNISRRSSGVERLEMLYAGTLQKILNAKAQRHEDAKGLNAFAGCFKLHYLAGNGPMFGNPEFLPCYPCVFAPLRLCVEFRLNGWLR